MFSAFFKKTHKSSIMDDPAFWHVICIMYAENVHRSPGRDASICRFLVDRVQGARNLLMRQTLCFAAQVLCFLAAFFIA